MTHMESDGEGTAADRPGKGHASPYSTGGGGLVLEHAYGAFLLSRLLLKLPVNGLGDDVAPTRVCYQQRTFPVDDLLVAGRTPAGHERQMFVAVRRNPVIGPKNRDSLALFTDYVRMVRDAPEEFTADRRRLGLAVATPHRAADDVASLARLARTQPSAKDFWATVYAPKAVNHRVRTRLTALNDLVAAAGGDSTRDTWRLLHALRVLPMRLEGDDALDRTRAVTDLTRRTDHDLASAEDLWRALRELSASYAPTAAMVDLPLLLRDLASRIREPGTAMSFGGETPRREGAPGEGGVRVCDARPRLLGVHAAIQVDQNDPKYAETGMHDGLPPYVPRDLDKSLRDKIRAAGKNGGFVLLTGHSSVGKTRTLFEAIRAMLPTWRLLQPTTSAAAKEFATTAEPQTVVWLDELQNYLDPPDSLLVETVRNLIAVKVVVVATMWPGEYNTRTAPRTPGQPDPYANDRRLLNLAEIVPVPDDLSPQERCRAEQLADDRRIRIALDTPDAGFTQVMAAGPQLVHWWEQAPAEQCYGKAIITAALDARRVGARAILTRNYLQEAAPGYISEVQQATANPDWFERGLDYATTLLHGATAALFPVAAGMSKIGGYEVSDYLYQHALAKRRTIHLPDIVWQALVQHHNPDDTDRLAHSAQRRGRYDAAMSLFRPTADAGSRYSALQLGLLQAQLGRVEDAAATLANLDNAGDELAAEALDKLFAKYRRENDLVKRARLGRDSALYELVELLRNEERAEDSLPLLTKLSNSGHGRAAGILAEVLSDLRYSNMLTERAKLGEDSAIFFLFHLLNANGQTQQFIPLATKLADDYHHEVANIWLVRALIEERMKDVLSQRVANSDTHAFYGLVELLGQETHTVDEALRLLRAPDRAGDIQAAIWIAKLLAKHRRIEELRARTQAGAKYAAQYLGLMLADEGKIEQAFELLHDRVRLGDQSAKDCLIRLQKRHCNIDELRRLVDGGSIHLADRLSELLAEHHQVDELRQRADIGDAFAESQLVKMLVEQDLLDELAGEVAAGTHGAIEALRDAR